jgi:DNA-binding transcriptional LysR family regulator
MRDIRRIDLNLLVALDALLEERSVTRAASRLALTQPTVSAMLARLRKLFVDPLFVRYQRGMQPTPRAIALAPALKQWLAEANSLVTGDRFDPSTAQITASLAANDYVQSVLIVPFIGKLRRQAPNAQLAVRSSQFEDVTAVLADGALDLCVTSNVELPSRELPSRVLYEESYIGVVRRGHPLKAKRAVTLDEFCRYGHVMVSPTDGRFVGPPDEALASIGRTRRVVVSAPGFLILPEILMADDLIAVVPERMLRGRMEGLRTFSLPLPVQGFSVILVWHRRLQNDPAHRWLRELLAATAQELRPHIG